MRIRDIFLLVTTFFSLLFQNSSVQAASAISVPPDARATADTAKAEAEAIRERKQNDIYRTEAENYVVTSDEEALMAEDEAAEAKTRLEELKEALCIAELEKDATAKEAATAYALAEQLTKDSEAAYASAEAAYREADRVESELQRKEAAINAYINKAQETPVTNPLTTSPAIDDELLRAESEAKRQEEEYQRLEEARRANNPTISVPDTDTTALENASSAAHARASYVGASAEEIGRRSQEAWRISEDKTSTAEFAFERYENLKSEVADAELIYNDNEKYALEARGYANQAVIDRDNLIISLENPRGSYYATVGTRFYSWHANDGVKGYQFAQPIYAGYWSEKFSYGLFTNHVSSHSN